MDILVPIQQLQGGCVLFSPGQSVFPEQAGLLCLPVCRCSPEGLKVLSLWWGGGVDTRWQAAQSKDPSVVLQGDYAASDALPIAL